MGPAEREYWNSGLSDGVSLLLAPLRPPSAHVLSVALPQLRTVLFDVSLEGELRIFHNALHGKLGRMTLYINAPLSEHGILEKTGEIQRVELRAHATELIYGVAAYVQGLAQEQWPDPEWRIEHVRTGRYVVKGEPRPPRS